MEMSGEEQHEAELQELQGGLAVSACGDPSIVPFLLTINTLDCKQRRSSSTSATPQRSRRLWVMVGSGLGVCSAG